MYGFITNLIEELPKLFEGIVATPTIKELFKFNKTSLKLDSETAEIFHHLFAKILYLSN